MFYQGMAAMAVHWKSNAIELILTLYRLGIHTTMDMFLNRDASGINGMMKRSWKKN